MVNLPVWGISEYVLPKMYTGRRNSQTQLKPTFPIFLVALCFTKVGLGEPLKKFGQGFELDPTSMSGVQDHCDSVMCHCKSTNMLLKATEVTIGHSQSKQRC